MALSDFETEIAAEGGKWAHYYEQADLDGLMTLYVEDAIVALHGQPALFGIDTIRDYFAQRIGKAEATFELDYELRETHGELAYIISKYWLKATDKTTGALYKEAGRSLLVYKRQDGQWKIAADIDQSTPDVTLACAIRLELNGIRGQITQWVIEQRGLSVDKSVGPANH
jgi:uncharacterized protein (TIGR02246 family)